MSRTLSGQQLDVLGAGEHTQWMNTSSESTARSGRGRHPIRVVTRRTGLSAAALRAWERRYEAVKPERTPGGQRLYSDEDIHRLTLLRQAVDGGRNIGHVAALETPELERLVREDTAATGGGALSPRDEPAFELPESVPGAGGRGAARVMEEAVAAAGSMDPRELEAVLTRGAMALTPSVLVDDVLVPLLRRIGLLWARGELGPASEHIASVVVRRFLDWLVTTQEGGSVAPMMVVGTPSGQVHEFGALLAGVTAATEGWRVMVLGPDLPGEGIAEAGVRKGAAVVALSALVPGEGDRLVREVRALRNGLPEEAVVMIGGPGAEEVRVPLEAAGVMVFEDLAGFRSAVRLVEGRRWPGWRRGAASAGGLRR
jgi:MerR family transcriptional regulator, light-induced transcriptional regulator